MVGQCAARAALLALTLSGRTRGVDPFFGAGGGKGSPKTRVVALAGSPQLDARRP